MYNRKKSTKKKFSDKNVLGTKKYNLQFFKKAPNTKNHYHKNHFHNFPISFSANLYIHIHSTPVFRFSFSTHISVQLTHCIFYDYYWFFLDRRNFHSFYNLIVNIVSSSFSISLQNNRKNHKFNHLIIKINQSQIKRSQWCDVPSQMRVKCAIRRKRDRNLE